MTLNRIRSRSMSCWQFIASRARQKCAIAALAAVALVAAMIVTQPLFAQVSTGTLSGNVLDPQGHVIAGASVSVTNVATGQVETRQSSSAGHYTVQSLIPGTYSVSVQAAGFQAQTVSNVIVSIGTTTAQNVSLQLGSTKTSINVTASATGLQTQSSDISTSVEPRLVNQLPISVGSGGPRSIMNFIFLVPGVVGGVNINKFAGGQATGSLVEVDGGSINTVTGGNFDSAGYTPSVDAVREFTITQSGYPAQFGRSTGGIINFGTRSGTNDYHGSVYDIYHNTALNANSWFNNLHAAANPANAHLYRRAVDIKNEYGLTFGGPISIPHVYNGRNRTFGFFSWEQFRQTLGSVSFTSVPTVANRNGDFSATLTNTIIGTNPCNGQPIYEGEIFDPATTTQVGSVYCRTPFDYQGQMNHIDPARFSQVAQNVLSYIPLPQTNALTNNFVYPHSHPILDTLETIRIDHSFNNSNKIFGSYNPFEGDQRNSGVVIPGPATPAVAIDQPTFLHDAHFGYDHTFSPTTFNHVVLSLFRFTNWPSSIGRQAGIDWTPKLGLGNNLSGTEFPTFNLGENYLSPGNWLQYQDYQNHVELTDNLLHTFGKHTLNIGFDLQYQEFTRNFQLFQSGTYNFSRKETAGTNQATTLSGNSFASFMLGQVSSASADIAAVVPQRRNEYAAVYIQDDYQPLPNLTLNLGLRYSVDTPYSEANNNVNNWDPTLVDPKIGIPGGLIFAGHGPGRSGISSRLADVYYKDFAPRLGFAWSPKIWNGKTVLRGNYGILYGPTPMNFAINGEPGFQDSPNFTDSLTPGGFTAPFTLDQGFPAFTRGVNFDPFQLNNTGSSPFYTARSFGRVAMVQNYGLDLQVQLPHDLVASLAYVGNSGSHLSSGLMCLNCLPLKYYGLGSALSQTFSAAQPVLSGFNIPYTGFTGSLAQGLQPFPQIGGINTANENIGQSSYNALFAKIQHRFANGLSLLASETWSKSLTNADSTLVGELPNSFQDPFNPKGEKSISALDYPNVVVVSYIYELPFGKNKPFLNRGGIVNEVVGGWEIGGIHHWQSGSPANFGCASGLPGDSPCFRFSLKPGVPIYSAAKQSGHFNPLTDVWFNPAAFVDPNNNTRIAAGGGYQYGTLRRNVSSIRYPTSPDTDFSFIKNTPVTSRATVQFRFELFNAFNQHRLGTPNQSPNSTAFGTIGGTQNGARVGQATLRINF